MTALARDLTAPAPPRSAIIPIVVAAVLGMGALSCMAQAVVNANAAGYAILALLPTCAAVACILIAVQRIRRQQQIGPVVDIARRMWADTWYCSRCDVVFLPGYKPVRRGQLRPMLMGAARHYYQPAPRAATTTQPSRPA